jgi:DNA-binding NtrC family response regulator
MARILLVDDESSIVKVLDDMMTRLGYEVVTASGGTEALKKLSSGGIDLVVTDLVMPNINGLQLIEEIQKTYPGVKIIAMSGGSIATGPAEYLQTASKLGEVACLAKPFTINDLSTLVTSLLAE